MSSFHTFDIETGTSKNLIPTMVESSELRWGFVRKVYAILTIQLLVMVTVGGLVVKFHPFATFLMTTIAGLVSYWTLLVMPFNSKYYVVLFPRNYVLRAICTINLALATVLACFFTHGKVILEAAILTTVVVVSLTLFTFWAVNRGHDLSFLGLFLLVALYMFMLFGLIQAFFLMGKLTQMIYAGITVLVFCGYIVFDTFNLIKIFTYDDYILAAVALFHDVLILFLALLIIFSNVLVILGNSLRPEPVTYLAGDT